MTRPAIRTTINLPARDTVRAFEARDTLQATVRWHEMWQEDHARAFTVAKVANLDLLNTIRQSLATMLRDGGTFEQWKAGLEPALVKAGWLGLVTDPDVTGADHDVYVGGRRLRTIYDTNLRTARSAGRWQRIQALKSTRPFLMYVAIGDHRTRPIHRRWGGLDPAYPFRIVLPVDHPAWAIYYPPNDWGCRCTVRQLSQRDLDRLKLRVTTDAELQRMGWLKADGTPGGGRQQVFHADGRSEPQIVPEGVGPGWSYNGGEAAMQPIADKLLRTVEATAATSIDAARIGLRQAIVPEVVEQVLRDPSTAFPLAVLDEALADAIGARGRVVTFTHEDLANQIAKRGRPASELYRAIMRLPEGAEVITVADRRLSLSFSGMPRLTATITTRDGAPRLTAFEWLSDRGLNQRVARSTIIRDQPFIAPTDAARRLLALPGDSTQSLVIGRAGAESPDSVRGFQRRIAADTMSHVRLKHFAGGTGNDPYPVTIADFDLIPRILASGNLRERQRGDFREQIWLLEVNRIFYIYVERVGRKQGQLIMRTFYKSTQKPKLFEEGVQ